MKHVQDHRVLDEDGDPSYLIRIFEGHTADGVIYVGEFKIYEIADVDRQGIEHLPTVARRLLLQRLRAGGRLIMNDFVDAEPVWTRGAMLLEHDRILGEDLAALGPRPSWWRAGSRRRYDREVRWLKKVHADDLRTMLATLDSKQREIIATLIGWKHP